MKQKLLLAAVTLFLSVISGGGNLWAETDYTSLMSDNWSNSSGGFQGGRERYQGANYTAGKVMYQSFTAPAAGIYEIKFYAVTSSTSDRGFDNIYGDNIAQAYASAGNNNKSTVAMTVINQTGCTLVADANIRTLSVEAAEGETIEYGIENIAEGGNWYTIKALSAKMKTVAEIFQDQYDEAYAIWQYSTENEEGARATFKTYVDAMNTALTGTLSAAQTAADNLADAVVTYENKSYPIKGSGVKYDFTSKMNMAINAWTCKQGNGPAQYGFTGATETYGNTAAGEVMYQTLTGLANGEYEIHFYAVANAANDGGVEANAAAKIVYVYANDQTLDIPVIKQSNCTPSDYEHTFTVMVKDGTLKYGITNNEAAGNWNICKNVALYMTGAPDLSDYYDAIDEKLVTANGLKSSPMKATVLTALQNAIDATEGYGDIKVIGTLETLSGNLTTAINNANTSIGNYTEALTILNAASTLDAEGQAVYTNSEAIVALQTVYNNRSLDAVNSDQRTAAAAAFVEAVKAQTTVGSDWTGVIVNPSFESELSTGWTSDGIGRQNNTAFGKTGTWYAEAWEPDGTKSISQTISALPAGVYSLSAKSRARGVTSAKLYAGENEKAITIVDADNTYTVEFACDDNASVTIGFEGVGTKAGSSWLAIDNFTLTLVSKSLADADDYAALASAISGKPLGFEAGEYAPYNNVAGCEALAAAKAIDPTKANAKATVTAATAALTNATWTANAEDVNAIYWADYTSNDIASDGYIHPLGWTNTGYNTRIYSDAAGNKDTNSGISAVNNLAMMMKYNTTYGENIGYSMPLKAGSIYKLTFKYCGWGNTPTTNVVLTDPNNETITLKPSFRPSSNDGNTNAEHWYEYTAYFTSTTGGDYVLAFNKVDGGQQQIGIGDIALYKLTSVTIDEEVTYANTQSGVENVILKRTIRVGANTLVLPFSMTQEEVEDNFGDDAKVYVISGFNATTSTISFAEQEGIIANAPCVLEATKEGSSFLLTDRELVASETAVTTVGNLSMIGTYAPMEEIPQSNNNYILYNDNLYYVNSVVGMDGTRAYFKVEGVSGTRVLSVVYEGDEATEIAEIDEEPVEDGVIYNLAGQVVGADYKGIAIINGKKVLLK